MGLAPSLVRTYNGLAMEKIRLTKEEKIVLRTLAGGERKTALLNDGEFFLAVVTLRSKGLVDAALNYSTIEDVRLSYFGKAYMQANPTLGNPIDWWRIIQMVATVITAIATTIALFIGCSLVG